MQLTTWEQKKNKFEILALSLFYLNILLYHPLLLIQDKCHSSFSAIQWFYIQERHTALF